MILMKYPRFYLKYGFSYVNQKGTHPKMKVIITQQVV
jgi:hypothetical protein